MLKTLPDASVHCAISSPPYMGLRSYSTEPQVWGGDPEHAHEWESFLRSRMTGGNGTVSAKQVSNTGSQLDKEPWHQSSCPCGAWRGELGSEPTPEQFIANLVEVFREVRRVLRPDGTCWLNLGDSYAGSGKGPTGHNGIQNAEERQGFGSGYEMACPACQGDTNGRDGTATPNVPGELVEEGWSGHDRNGAHGGTGLPVCRRCKGIGVLRSQSGGRRNKTDAPAGYKAKDLMLMPFRVALALQADGWWLRSAITWCKAAPMPESVTDRPTNATEMVFLLSKSAKYFYDADAVRESTAHPELIGKTQKVSYADASALRNDGDRVAVRSDGRNLWNYWVLPPEPFPLAHFATFPTEIPRRAILAGTSERGCCPTCGAPWARVVERTKGTETAPPKLNQLATQGIGHNGTGGSTLGLSGSSAGWAEHGSQQLTRGWAASCRCAPADPIPCVVLDPFSGSGTTGLVASRLGRDYIGCELSPIYAAMSEARINSDEMLFQERVQVEAPADFVPVPLFSEVSA